MKGTTKDIDKIIRQGWIMFFTYAILLILVITVIIGAHELGKKVHKINTQMEQNQQGIELIEEQLDKAIENNNRQNW